MYEPKYLPQLNETIPAFSGMRFSVAYDHKYRKVDDPDADPPHIHNSLEIFLNISGDISFLVNGTLYPVPAGDAILTCPGDIHVGIFHRSSVQEHVCIWIDTDITSPIFSFLRKADFCPLFSFDEPTKKELQSLVSALSEICERQGSELEKAAYILQILTVFKKEKTQNATQTNLPKAFQKVLDDIQENFAEIRCVNEIAEAHYLSASTLTRRFRKYLHTSPREYLESVRLSNAALFLCKGDSVTEACMRSGFSDLSRFIVIFKRKFGVTPLKYKKSFGENSSFQSELGRKIAE